MNDFDSIIKRMTVTRLEPGDYTGEDGLLYCGKCRTPKQFRLTKVSLRRVLFIFHVNAGFPSFMLILKTEVDASMPRLPGACLFF